MTAPTITTADRSALACYGAALRRAAGGGATELRLIDPAGVRAPVRLSPAEWCGPLRPGDASLLARCHGTTLDIGCGPGRLAAALAGRRIPALGIDVSPEAIRQARRRGATARVACVMCADIDTAWRHLLLADGNIGIGGDPGRLLDRCRGLLAPDGDILVELEAPGAPSWTGTVSLGFGGRISAPFAWAGLGIDALDDVVDRSALRIDEIWTEASRWFARICAV
jgi:SAM-dependent methyltransferase